VEVLIGAGDAWGVAAPVFLAVHLAAGIAATGCVLAVRRRVTAGRPPDGEPTPYEPACLAGGRLRVVMASAGRLHHQGAVRLRSDMAAVQAAHDRNPHLDPGLRPAFAAYGAEAVALSTALYGARTPARLDRSFIVDRTVSKVLSSSSGSPSAAVCADAIHGTCASGCGGCGGGACGGGGGI